MSDPILNYNSIINSKPIYLPVSSCSLELACPVIIIHVSILNNISWLRRMNHRSSSHINCSMSNAS